MSLTALERRFLLVDAAAAAATPTPMPLFAAPPIQPVFPIFLIARRLCRCEVCAAAPPYAPAPFAAMIFSSGA